jgi:nitrogen regulatory protein PII
MVATAAVMEAPAILSALWLIARTSGEARTDALKEAGVTGYTILPVRGGSGASGEWSRAGQVSTASGMNAVVCLIRPERQDALLDAAFKVVERHMGVVSITDAEVLRAERF